MSKNIQQRTGSGAEGGRQIPYGQRSSPNLSTRSTDGVNSGPFISSSPTRRASNMQKTYNTKDSRVVTHRSTYLAIRSLTMGERTGSRIFFNLWPYLTM
ncbi:hypothetical protein BJ508DRAFT_216327 [Ascobolus immersus RN42]|uniref:Uncharacterized protein n=1 Tax=Ascobolus immersus RN42 TaxID=1160509 RepID=A0A3N4HU80_ASCIM|nr:hypothetical protein BJ508DRAFT_216327 [Ascobolus immersus RN42]